MIGNMSTVGWWIPDAVVPNEGDVEAGVTFGANAELTGTFVVPAEEDVEDGVEYGDAAEFTGTLEVIGGAADYPAETDVRLGVDFDNGDSTGLCAVPAAADVQLGVAVDATVGTFVAPSEGDVRYGVEYGAAAEYTGALGGAPGTGLDESTFDDEFSDFPAADLMTQFGTPASYSRAASLETYAVATGFPRTITAIFNYGVRGRGGHLDRRQFADGEGDVVMARATIYADDDNGVSSILPGKDTITDANSTEWTVKGIEARVGGLWRLEVGRYLHQRTGRSGVEARRG